MDDDLFTCPACGFLMFDEPPGTYDICFICGWEDDHVQLKHPFMGGGANRQSLCEYQKVWVEAIPLNVKERVAGRRKLLFKRDPLWRPLSKDECKPTPVSPKTGIEYFEEAGEDSPTLLLVKALAQIN